MRECIGSFVPFPQRALYQLVLAKGGFDLGDLDAFSRLEDHTPPPAARALLILRGVGEDTLPVWLQIRGTRCYSSSDMPSSSRKVFWALLRAAQGGLLDLVRGLWAQAFVLGDLACTAAASGGALAVLKWLKSHECPFDAQECLFAASKEGHVEMVGFVVAAGADVNQATTSDGTTVLYIASEEGHVDVVRTLLAAGADVNQATTDDGTTPLYMASQKGHVEVVRALLAAGVDCEPSQDG